MLPVPELPPPRKRTLMPLPKIPMRRGASTAHHNTAELEKVRQFLTLVLDITDVLVQSEQLRDFLALRNDLPKYGDNRRQPEQR